MYFERNRPGRSRIHKVSFAALSIILGVGASVTAFASQRESPMPAPLRGLVTAVSNNGLQLQTSNGTVSVVLARGATHVVRSVMGSTADVTTGKRVDLHLVKGTHTVDAIRVEQTKPAGVRPGAVHTLPRGVDRPLPHGDAGGSAPQRLSGQVISLNAGVLTLRYGNGSTGNFSLGPNVNVNEALSGTLADLGIGETVQVFLGKPGSAARAIIIINA